MTRGRLPGGLEIRPPLKAKSQEAKAIDNSGSPDKLQGPAVKAIKPIDFDGVEALSFRQIDAMNGVPKGTAFRSFKRLRGELIEGRDYYYLPQHSHGAFIQSLRETGQIYHSTTHLVLITRSGYERLQQPGKP